MLCAASIPPAEAQPFDIGHRIYSGLPVAGITARLGEVPALPATLFPCRNCHGLWGEGRSEAQVTAPPLRSLTNPDDLLAIMNNGKGRNGHRLSTVMPRYALDRQAAGSLFDYLKALDAAETAGVTTGQVMLALDEASAFGGIAALRRALRRSQDQRDKIFGRTVAIGSTDTEAFLAVSAKAAIAVAGAPQPVLSADALTGDELPDSTFAMTASFAQQFALLFDRLIAEKRPLLVFLDGSDRSERLRQLFADMQRKRGFSQDVVLVPPDTVLRDIDWGGHNIVVLGRADGVKARLPPSSTAHILFGFLDELGHGLGQLNGLAERIFIIDPHYEMSEAMIGSGKPAGVLWAEAVSVLIREVLRRCGRHLTRSCFMRRLRSEPIVLGSGWVLDYRKFPLTGLAPRMRQF